MTQHQRQMQHDAATDFSPTPRSAAAPSLNRRAPSRTTVTPAALRLSTIPEHPVPNERRPSKYDILITATADPYASARRLAKALELEERNHHTTIAQLEELQSRYKTHQVNAERELQAARYQSQQLQRQHALLSKTYNDLRELNLANVRKLVAQDRRIIQLQTQLNTHQPQKQHPRQHPQQDIRQVSQIQRHPQMRRESGELDGDLMDLVHGYRRLL